jgi:FAD/FMN-containing dehydrogenase
MDEAAFQELERSFSGRLVRAGDPGYDEARRIWNGSISKFPALIAYCTGVADVVAALEGATRSGLPVAVRSGGHSFPGQSLCDGGLVIDLSAMNGIRVDPLNRTVRAQAGVLLGALDRETQHFGMAVPAGIVTHTGLAGLTLGGGIGWLMRKYGLTVDQLLSADMVTADGGFVTADESRDPELFWGLRGAGTNFGVVTEFEFRLNPVGPLVLAGPILWPLEEAPHVLAFYRDWITDVPD